MKKIMTVLGPAAPKDLGFCQCHEHLLLSKGVSFQRNPVLLMDDLEKSTREALCLVRAGGGTIVDAQPGGCSRMAEGLVTISRRTGLHIVASTGFHKLCFYPEDHWLYTKSLEELGSIFYHELTQGMYREEDQELLPDPLSARAGIVKMALDTQGLTPVYKKLFTAGALASIQADVPVMVHIEQGSDPLELFSFLKELGVAPQRMIFCHMDRAVPDLHIHKQLLAKGIFLEYDTIGRFRYHSDAREIEIFRTMLYDGYDRQLLFSLDTTRARLKAYEPDGVGLDYLLTTFLPLMAKSGITPKQISQISHENFIRAFTGQP